MPMSRSGAPRGIGDCWYINPHNTLATIERQMDLYKRALDEYGKPFPAEVPMRREVFVAKTRAEAIRLRAALSRREIQGLPRLGAGQGDAARATISTTISTSCWKTAS